MGNWRLAKSIETLRRQLNEMFPRRDKKSDGWISDAAHARRTSDHNPNSAGAVTAIDLTLDKDKSDGEGIDCARLAEVLQKSKDKRIKYLIFNSQITQKTDVTKWKKYEGKNPHKHHIHISVSSDPKFYDDGKEWDLASLCQTGTDNGLECFYTVKAGDTVSKVIKQFGLTMVEFYQLNNFKHDSFDADRIKIGDKFRIGRG